MDTFPLPSVTGLSSLPVSGQAIAPGAASTATFTASAWPDTKLVEISVSTAAVTVTFDGSVPTATNGLIIPAGIAPFTWSINKAIAAKFRAVSGTAAVYGVPLYY
jgi:hypothetical protein